MNKSYDIQNYLHKKYYQNYYYQQPQTQIWPNNPSPSFSGYIQDSNNNNSCQSTINNQAYTPIEHFDNQYNQPQPQDQLQYTNNSAQKYNLQQYNGYVNPLYQC